MSTRENIRLIATAPFKALGPVVSDKIFSCFSYINLCKI